MYELTLTPPILSGITTADTSSFSIKIGDRSDYMRSLLQNLDADFQFSNMPSLAPLVNWAGAKNHPIHRWFRYREGFSPALITELGLGYRLLDPFSGCGSIMIGAAQLGRESVGIDLNPLATFVARVKLSPLSHSQIERIKIFAEQFERLAPEVEAWPVPDLAIASKLFEPEITDTLLRLRTLIGLESQDTAIQDFLMLAWIAILQEVGSYFKEGNGIKYRNKKRMPFGYIVRPEGVWQAQRFGSNQRGFVYSCFGRQLKLMISDTSNWGSGTWPGQTVIEGDSLHVLESLDPHSFDSIVFSPPYANRFDYFESMKAELWFGGFVKSYEEMDALRKKSIRSHLGAALDQTSGNVPELETLIQLMDRNSYSWKSRVPALLRGYFQDLSKVLVSLRPLLALGGRCFVIVGNSAYGGVIFPTDTLLARLGRDAGFQNVSLFTIRHLTVAPQQRRELDGLEHYMRESVVVFA